MVLAWGKIVLSGWTKAEKQGQVGMRESGEGAVDAVEMRTYLFLEERGKREGRKAVVDHFPLESNVSDSH